MQHLLVAIAVGALTIAPPAVAQTGPVNGVRPADVRTHAITGATVVVQPDRTIENATIIIRNGVIEAVGQDVEVPPGARVWPGDHGVHVARADLCGEQREGCRTVDPARERLVHTN